MYFSLRHRQATIVLPCKKPVCPELTNSDLFLKTFHSPLSRRKEHQQKRACWSKQQEVPESLFTSGRVGENKGKGKRKMKGTKLS